MAELGSHQLDAASIFISALAQKPGEHVHPLSVHAVGGRHTAPKDRDAADHVYCTFDFPGQGYDYSFDVGYEDEINSYPPKMGIPAYNEGEHSNKRVVVTYSSINGNGYGGYGEVVMGTKATMVLDREKEVMLYPIAGTSYKSSIKINKKRQAIMTPPPVATLPLPKQPKVTDLLAEDTAKRSNIGHGASSKVTSATSLAVTARLL